MAKTDPTIQQLIDGLLAADKTRVQAKAPAKTATSAAKPKIVFSGIPDANPYNPEPKKAGGSSSSGHHPSNFHKLLDIISRPLQALEVGTLHAQQNHGSQLSKIGSLVGGMGAGFTGHERTTGQQLVEGKYGKGNHRGLEGFLVDVGMDPLNFIGPGAIKAVGKGIKAVRGVKDVAQAEKAVETAKAVENAITATRPVGTSITIGKGVAKERKPIVAATKSFGKASTRPKPVTAVAKTKSFGKAKPLVVEAKAAPVIPDPLPQVADKVKVEVPKAGPPKIKEVPPPKPVKFDALPQDFKEHVAQVAQQKAIQAWPNSDLARKMGKGLGPVSWEQIARDPAKLRAVTSTPEFKNWYAPIVAAEKHAATAEFNARQLAKHADFVKKLNETLPVTTPADAVIKAAEDLPKALPKDKLAIADAAANLHLTNHGQQALTPLGQARLRQTVSNEYFKTRPITLKNNVSAIKSINEIYKHAEDTLFKAAPIDGPRLSSIIDTLPNDVLKDPAKLEKAILGGNVQDVARQAAADLPKPTQKQYIRGLLDSLKASGNATEASQLSKVDLTNAVKIAPKETPAVFKVRTAEAVNKDLGLVSAKLPIAPVQTDKIYKDVSEYASHVPEWLNRRFSAAYGQTAWEHSAIRQGENAVNISKEKDINFLRDLIKGTNKDGFNASFKAAQVGGSGQHADEITSYFNHLHEMMTNAGVSEQEFVNKLKRISIFKAGKGAKPIDENLGWDAWKSFKLGNMHSAKMMAYYADAAHNATLDSVIAGHLGNLFGAVKDLSEVEYQAARKAGYISVNDVPSLQGILFPKDYAPRIQQLMDSVGPKGGRAEGFLKQYDKVLGLYKTGLTKYLPSHHVTNDIGQKYMAWLDGLTNPQWYSRAIKIMAHQGAADTGVSDAGRFILKTGSGHQLDEVATMKAFEDAGLRPSFAGIADLAGEEPKFKSAIPAAVDKFSQAREVHNRLAHFMFALNQEKGALPDAIQAAAMRVQKHHADYGDLTEFERKVMRRIIPFYTWQRKVAPTLVRQALMNPAKIMVYPKAQMAINQHFGVIPEPGNPFPGLSMIPSFMMEGNQAIYAMHGGNPVLGGPRTPFDDVVGKAINHPLGNIMDMLTPAVKMPYELKSGVALGNSDIHVLNKNQDRLSYLENNTPLLSVLMRVTRRDPLHGFAPTKKSADEQGVNWAAFLNLLTAGGVREDTSRYQTIASKEQKKGKKP